MADGANATTAEAAELQRAAREQARAVGAVETSMSDINAAIQQQAALAKQSTTAAQSTLQETLLMQEAADVFRVH
jgi:methyl-accepting chemotaxis protein